MKGITSDNKLMNLCEIRLFHKVWGVSKGTRDNYHEIWWKCFRAKINGYISIWGVSGGEEVHLNFLFIIHESRKSTKAWHILKSNSTFNFFFLGWIINFLGKEGPTPIYLQSEYSSSNWFHSNTPNSRHLFNTNC